jgi:hypothetical protein
MMKIELELSEIQCKLLHRSLVASLSREMNEEAAVLWVQLIKLVKPYLPPKSEFEQNMQRQIEKWEAVNREL